MKNNIRTSAFTLVELIVAITIFWLIMTSVMSIFILSSQMSLKIELTRSMQDNVKTSLEDIAESVRTMDIIDVADITPDNCSSFTSWDSASKLCLWERNLSGVDSVSIEYFIAQKFAGSWSRVINIDECKDFNDEDDETICRLVKKIGSDIYPLTNNLVAVEGLNFEVYNTDVPRVIINLTLRPAYRKWLSIDMLKWRSLNVQTTLSERVIQTK